MASHKSSITSQSKTFRKSKITSIVGNTDMIGQALVSDSLGGGKESGSLTNRSKSSGAALPQINKKLNGENGQKKAEITNVCQVNDFLGFSNQTTGMTSENGNQPPSLPFISTQDILANRVLGSVYHPSRTM